MAPSRLEESRSFEKKWGLAFKNMPGTCCNRNCRSLYLVHNIYAWIFFFMVSHTIMTIIQCMIMAYVLTIGQVQTLQPVDASLSWAIRDDDVLTKSGLQSS